MTVATTPAFAALWAYTLTRPGPLTRLVVTSDDWLVGDTRDAHGQFLGSLDQALDGFRGLARAGVCSRRQAERLAAQFLSRVGRHGHAH